MKKILFALFFLAPCFAAMAASFNCSNALTDLEKTICNDARLNEADGEMGEMYFSVRQKLSDYDIRDFKQEHTEWLKARSVGCKPMDSDCLLNIYTQRIAGLKKRNSVLTARLEDLLGKYALKEDDDCHLRVDVYKDDSKYKYRVSTTKRKANGLLALSVDGEDYYLDFKGLLADDPPATISGSIMDDTIVIQNYGNAMNEYTKISECDAKYLELVKQ